MLQVQAIEEAYAENWQLKEHHLKPLSFLGGSIYAQVDNLQNVEFETDERGVLISENAEERERREENEALELDARIKECDEGYEEMELNAPSTNVEKSE